MPQPNLQDEKRVLSNLFDAHFPIFVLNLEKQMLNSMSRHYVFFHCLHRANLFFACMYDISSKD